MTKSSRLTQNSPNIKCFCTLNRPTALLHCQHLHNITNDTCVQVAKILHVVYIQMISLMMGRHMPKHHRNTSANKWRK